MKMVTVLDKLKNMLVQRGMFDVQADEVLKIAIPVIESFVPDYKVTWGSSYDSYPEVMYSLWWMCLKIEALKWIEENIPQAWYKPMFQEESNEVK